MAGSDSEDDAPILGRAKRERATKSYKIDSGSGSDDDDDEDEDQPLKRQVKGAQKKGKAKREADDSDDGVTDLTGESPKKKAKTPAKKPAKTPAKAKVEPKVEDEPVENLDDDEEALLLQIMNNHSSPAKAPAKTPGKPPASAGRSAAAGASAPASHKKDDGKGAKGEASASKGAGAAKTEAADVEDATLGSARVETSKIKFSRSIELKAPNPKKISRTTFLVQCEEPGLDFEGDSGVIGTLKSSTEQSLQLDIKGQVFEGSVLPCNSMMVVELGANEAKIEAIMNDFVQLHKIQNPHDDNLEVELSDEDDDEAPQEDDDDAKGKKGKAKDKAKPNSKGKGSKAKKKTTKAKKTIAVGKKKK